MIIAYPIWWGIEPKIIDTFVESYNFSGKTIIPVCTSGGSNIRASEDHLKNLVSEQDFYRLDEAERKLKLQAGNNAFILCSLLRAIAQTDNAQSNNRLRRVLKNPCELITNPARL